MWILAYKEGDGYKRVVLQPNKTYQVGCVGNNQGALPANFIALNEMVTVRNRVKFEIGRTPSCNHETHTPISIVLQSTVPITIENDKSFALEKHEKTRSISHPSVPTHLDSFSVFVVDLPGVLLKFHWLPLKISYTSLDIKSVDAKRKQLRKQNVDYRLCSVGDDCTHLLASSKILASSPLSYKVLWCLSLGIPIVTLDWIDLVLKYPTEYRRWYANEDAYKKYSITEALGVALKRQELLKGILVFTFHTSIWSALLENMGANVVVIRINDYLQEPTSPMAGMDANFAVNENALFRDIHSYAQNNLLSCYFLPVYASHTSSSKEALEVKWYENYLNEILHSVAACFGTYPISSTQIEKCLLKVDANEILFPHDTSSSGAAAASNNDNDNKMASLPVGASIGLIEPVKV